MILNDDECCFLDETQFVIEEAKTSNRSQVRFAFEHERAPVRMLAAAAEETVAFTIKPSSHHQRRGREPADLPIIIVWPPAKATARKFIAAIAA